MEKKIGDFDPIAGIAVEKNCHTICFQEKRQNFNAENELKSPKIDIIASAPRCVPEDFSKATDMVELFVGIFQLFCCVVNCSSGRVTFSAHIFQWKALFEFHPEKEPNSKMKDPHFEKYKT
jgi:hypothetical protein